MWKLLPLCLLVSCAASEEQDISDGNEPSRAGVVRQVDLVVESSPIPTGGQPSRRTFQRQGIEGWLDETGAWHINGDVRHGRLRCGTYETGIQLGRGSPACSDVQWLSDVEYATRLRHCNSASRVHAGGGVFSNAALRLEEVTCVRVVVRCEGTC